MGKTFDRRKIMDRWIATENIGRYQAKLNFESDICERKLLEELIAIEKAKFSKIPWIKAFISPATVNQ